MRALLPCAFALLTLAARPAHADRTAYAETCDLEARSATLVVRHHHDWSRLLGADGSRRLQFSPTTPFGVDAETSRLEFHSAQGTLVARVTSPPLSHLEVSADGRYVIGLSNIKLLNFTQLVVCDASGELLQGQPFEVRVRDPEGVEFAVPFERMALERQDHASSTVR